LFYTYQQVNLTNTHMPDTYQQVNRHTYDWYLSTSQFNSYYAC